ncbi:MAG: P1 family peptidase [Pseudomonadota bacterium]
MRPGPRNLITDVPGLTVGNAQDGALKSGVTVLRGAAPFTAGINVMGGAPGTRETDLLAPDKTVQQVNALVLSGGSAFGLAAADGVAATLRKTGIGFAVGPHVVPIVPAAIIFDLASGGDTAWDANPYPALGAKAADAAVPDFEIGSQGAGTGATTVNLKGGLGSASLVLPSGYTVGALVVVNALGSATVEDSPHFHAAPCELDAEFGGLGPKITHNAALTPRIKLTPGEATTIAIVATDAALDKAGCTRMATAAQDGMARALWPSHTPMDGDLIFGVSTQARELQDAVMDPLTIGHAASVCLARAIARAVYEATQAREDILPTWQDRFGG